MKLIFVGAQGCGKGTQAGVVADSLNGMKIFDEL